jgi:hypothetical protein
MPHTMHAERPTRVALAVITHQHSAPRVFLARTRVGFEVPADEVDAGHAPEEVAQSLVRELGLRVGSSLLVKDIPLAGALTRVFVMDGSAQPEAAPGRGPVYWWRSAGMEEAFHVLRPEFEPLVALLDKLARRSHPGHPT